MKKHILLIFTFMISFILLIDNVEAAKEMTCWYGKGVEQPGTIVSQDKNGNRTYWIYDADKSFQYASKISGVEENKNELTSCPKCLDFIDSSRYKANYADYSSGTKCKDGYVNLYKSYEKAWTQDDVDSRQFLPTTDLSDNQKNNMKVCEYSGNSVYDVTFYIDTSSGKIYSTIVDYDNLPDIQNGNSFILMFTKYSFKKEYNESKCPLHIYVDEEVGGTGVSGEIVYTYKYYLDSSKISKEAKKLYLQNVGEHGGEDKEEEPTVDINSCGDLFSEELIDEINKVMNLIRSAVPILLIVFGITDFFKATFDSTEDDMKKSRDRFIKRIIAAIIVFLVPFFVNLVLDVANTVWSDINTDTCISTNE